MKEITPENLQTLAQAMRDHGKPLSEPLQEEWTALTQDQRAEVVIELARITRQDATRQQSLSDVLFTPTDPIQIAADCHRREAVEAAERDRKRWTVTAVVLVMILFVGACIWADQANATACAELGTGCQGEVRP